MEVLNNSEFWSEVYISIERAQSIEPKRALKAIESFDIEIPFVLKNDDIEEIYVELKKDFKWLNNFYYKIEQGLNTSLSREEVEELVGICKWIIDTANNWTKESDPYFKTVAICLIIVAWLNTNIWLYIKNSIKNTDLMNELIPQITNSKFILSSKNSIYICEREAINSMNLAIEERNWLNIANGWSSFRISGFHECRYVFVKGIFQLANAFSKDKFLDSMKSSNEFILMNIMIESDTFSMNDRLFLALNTTNNLFRFALLFSMELENLVFSDEQEILMAKILLSISLEIEAAKVWFFIFNRHLIRFSFFSGAFGIYLAEYADDIGMDIYLESLGSDGFSEISNRYSGNREILTKVFERFGYIAKGEKRYIFWKKVYDKYVKEGLVGINGSKFMHDIHYSVFDYAVVKYYIENLGHNEINRLEIIKNKELKNIHLEWQTDFSDLLSSFYYLISFLQPIYHSIFVIENNLETLQPNIKEYIPLQLINDKKTCLQFDLVIKS